MPLTVIYVHEPNTTLTIDAGGAELLHGPPKQAATSPVAGIATDKPVTLDEGAYMVDSKRDVVVRGAGLGERYDVHTRGPRAAAAEGAGVINKDDWPDPPKKFFPSKQEIFAWLNAKGGSPF
ncbi:MAG TPA: hypothetical protein VK427_03005 [Kofleriaceae bacterium]|nr:hypothetical protein [Kofleriaceae bacterium]